MSLCFEEVFVSNLSLWYTKTQNKRLITEHSPVIYLSYNIRDESFVKINGYREVTRILFSKLRSCNALHFHAKQSFKPVFNACFRKLVQGRHEQLAIVITIPMRRLTLFFDYSAPLVIVEA